MIYYFPAFMFWKPGYTSTILAAVRRQQGPFGHCHAIGERSFVLSSHTNCQSRDVKYLSKEGGARCKEINLFFTF